MCMVIPQPGSKAEVRGFLRKANHKYCSLCSHPRRKCLYGGEGRRVRLVGRMHRAAREGSRCKQHPPAAEEKGFVYDLASSSVHSLFSWRKKKSLRKTIVGDRGEGDAPHLAAAALSPAVACSRFGRVSRRRRFPGRPPRSRCAGRAVVPPLSCSCCTAGSAAAAASAVSRGY